jgi:hypothetical protein
MKRELFIFLVGMVAGVGFYAMVALLYSLAKEEVIDILSRAKQKRQTGRDL